MLPSSMHPSHLMHSGLDLSVSDSNTFQDSSDAVQALRKAGVIGFHRFIALPFPWEVGETCFFGEGDEPHQKGVVWTYVFFFDVWSKTTWRAVFFGLLSRLFLKLSGCFLFFVRMNFGGCVCFSWVIFLFMFIMVFITIWGDVFGFFEPLNMRI